MRNFFSNKNLKIKNYFKIIYFLLLRDHAKELGNQVPKEAPLIFDKPISSIITQGAIEVRKFS